MGHLVFKLCEPWVHGAIQKGLSITPDRRRKDRKNNHINQYFGLGKQNIRHIHFNYDDNKCGSSWPILFLPRTGIRIILVSE